MFKVVCPECGSIESARWVPGAFMVACRGCGHRFDYRGHTYRPVTGHMTEAERKEHYRYRERQRAYDSTPARKEHNRMNARRYYREHKEERRAKSRAYREAHKDEINAKRRARYRAQRAGENEAKGEREP